MPRKPAPQPDVRNCSNCAHFLPNQADEYGYCRRYPPIYAVVHEQGVFIQPSTSDSDLCGEYSRKLQS